MYNVTMEYRFIFIDPTKMEGWKEGNILFNDKPDTFYLQLYGIRYMVKNHSDSEREGRKEMFYLTMHSKHFNCGYMASDTW